MFVNFQMFSFEDPRRASLTNVDRWRMGQSHKNWERGDSWRVK